MSQPEFVLTHSHPLVVGSLGNLTALSSATPETLAGECDIAEIRLDLIYDDYEKHGTSLWQHLDGFPLLFTARRHSEGSPVDLPTQTRQTLLKSALQSASLLDIEVASIPEMRELIADLNTRKMPWIASYHRFDRLPTIQELAPLAVRARDAGAKAFKFAATIHSSEDLDLLARLQTHPFDLPAAGMGMGKLGPVSRLLCAQHGSVLNYGFIGQNETAPGQWPAKLLRDAIRASTSI